MFFFWFPLLLFFSKGNIESGFCRNSPFPSSDGTCHSMDEPMAGAFQDVLSRGKNFGNNNFINDYRDRTEEPNVRQCSTSFDVFFAFLDIFMPWWMN